MVSCPLLSPPGDPGNPSAVGTAFLPVNTGTLRFTPARKSVIMKQTAPLTEVYAMPKAKWNLNTIYISERLQESLRPISRCALTTVVAPMGYGKTIIGF